MSYQNGYGYQQTAPQGNALDWDAEFTAEERNQNPLLPEGDYWFEIMKLDRGHHSGSDKVPPCHKATVTFKILAPQGEVIITENYFVIDLDWARQKNTTLFASIGLASREDVEAKRPIKPHWSNEIAGRRGVCHVAPRTYTKDGQQHQINDLKYLYYKWKQPNIEPVAPAAVSQPYQQPVQTYVPQQGYQQPQYTPPAPPQYQPPQGYPQQNPGYQPPHNGYGGGRY